MDNYSFIAFLGFFAVCIGIIIYFLVKMISKKVQNPQLTNEPLQQEVNGHSTSNPAFKKNPFANISVADGQEAMTLAGSVNKTILLFSLVLLTASLTWLNQSIFMDFWIPILLTNTIVGFVIIFKPTLSPVLSPVYALWQGLAIWAISAFYEQSFPWIVIQAVGLTFWIFATLLFLYKTHIVEATENFRLMVVSATGWVALLYIMDLILMAFWKNVSFIHDGGTYGILFSLFVVSIASMNLVLDFDFIEKWAEWRAPKYMEWYAGFWLLVTLIWLYLEILRMLAKSRKR